MDIRKLTLTRRKEEQNRKDEKFLGQEAGIDEETLFLQSSIEAQT
jgi:hypothetical protein